ncbi:uncharacterized protein BP01DRAFT_242603 [Aspergillus saccharolyticus JOP 1030-1]|uniref:Uncharacterized protein n=1 Tax=Aspergillus saccharolyticus JOP 1030-1 TaxID=1450539 RepID=A0A318ZHF9_9EURO|nr:hypothetical protein BP01DRAFT_242603 [Aspergillus saccharolyticus JOP 1030-1]PYH47006.1 hypothetical protein BP01DRAFT_242603 [Aspergillus saccharolyticus JOP 1030-1]
MARQSTLRPLADHPFTPVSLWCLKCLRTSVKNYDPSGGKNFAPGCVFDAASSVKCRQCAGRKSNCIPVCPSSQLYSQTKVQRLRIEYDDCFLVWLAYGLLLKGDLGITGKGLSWAFTDSTKPSLLRGPVGLAGGHEKEQKWKSKTLFWLKIHQVSGFRNHIDAVSLPYKVFVTW